MDFLLISIKSSGMTRPINQFVNSVNYAFAKGQLSVTQRRGIIKLIPKKSAETDLSKKLASNYVAKLCL